MKRAPFTLIEMLVVISIIGILAAMLSGPLMSARKTALSKSCLNNLKNLGYAVQMYRDAHKQMPYAKSWYGLFPDDHYYDRYKDNTLTPEDLPLPISLALENYAKPVELFRCPGDDKGYSEFKKNELSGGTSYEWSMRLNGQVGEPRGWGGRQMKASYVPVMWDCAAFHGTVRTETVEVDAALNRDNNNATDTHDEVEVRTSTKDSRNILYLDNSATGM